MKIEMEEFPIKRIQTVCHISAEEILQIVRDKMKILKEHGEEIIGVPDSVHDITFYADELPGETLLTLHVEFATDFD